MQERWGWGQFLGSSGQESLMLPKVSMHLCPEAFLPLETWAGTSVNLQTAVPICKDLCVRQTTESTEGPGADQGLGKLRCAAE